MKAGIAAVKSNIGRRVPAADQRRRMQADSWMQGINQEALLRDFFSISKVRACQVELENEVSAIRFLTA